MKTRKIFAAAIAAVMCLTFSSCGKNENVQSAETKAAETTSEGKKKIKMTVLTGIDTAMELRIADFNRTSEEYEIEVSDRSGVNLSNVIDTINLEIIAGNTPDIIDVFFLPKESYIEKGLFADYYDFIDSDPELSREDFVESVFKACEVDGGLYENIRCFDLDTLMGKSSIAGDMSGRTSDDFIDLMEKYPDKNFCDMPMSRSSMFEQFMKYGWHSYVDEETGKCDFNNEKFLRALEYCNTYPKEADNRLMHPDWRENEAENLRSGKTVFSFWGRYISDFYDLRRLEDYTFGEPVVIAGYPDSEGNGVLINAQGGLSVFESSPVKDGAWEFLKYYYSDEYQKWVFKGDGVTAGGCFPVKKSALELMAEDAQKGLYMLHLDDYSDEYTPNTDEDNQRIIDLINGAVCKVDRSDSNYVYDIIMEEADMYFAGQRPAKLTAEIIQNRVQNYLDERQ